MKEGRRWLDRSSSKANVDEELDEEGLFFFIKRLGGQKWSLRASKSKGIATAFVRPRASAPPQQAAAPQTPFNRFHHIQTNASEPDPNFQYLLDRNTQRHSHHHPSSKHQKKHKMWSSSLSLLVFSLALTTVHSGWFFSAPSPAPRPTTSAKKELMSTADSLVYAANTNDIWAVKKAIKLQVDVNGKGKNGLTPLIWASFKNHIDIVELLLQHHANPNAKGTRGNTALIAASQSGRIELVQLLLAAKADVNARTDNGATSLTFASADGHTEVVRMLLEHQADVTARVANGYTALLLACNNGKEGIVQLLLDHNADPTKVGHDGKNAQELAASNNHASIVEMLRKNSYDHGVDVEL